MSATSLFYRKPLLYSVGMKLYHRQGFRDRYRFMASFAHAGDTVLEPGCGPAPFASFLSKDVQYRGFDTNENFIAYAAKRFPKAHIYVGNVLDPLSYSDADVVVACDVLHHLPKEERSRFVKYCFDATQKYFIICEEGRHGNQTQGILYPVQKLIFALHESDGTNAPKLEEVWTKKELQQQITEGFDVIPHTIARSVKEIGRDSIIVFQKL